MSGATFLFVNVKFSSKLGILPLTAKRKRPFLHFRGGREGSACHILCFLLPPLPYKDVILQRYIIHHLMTIPASEIFDRTERLLGSDALQRLQDQRVLLLGVGGVGSWCAEGLVRSGIGHLTMVDPDSVNASNINRQLMATTLNVGEPKAEALRSRLAAINPHADITAVTKPYNQQTCSDFDLDAYDFVIDAIDSLQDKALLILNATAARCRFFSSMGAALKLDPQKICVAEFWKAEGCPLARALRKRFRRNKTYPARKFQCVYSPEVQPNRGEGSAPSALSYSDPLKAQVNGSMVHITAVFGFTLSALVVNSVVAEQH